MNKTIRVSGLISKDVEGILLGCEVLGEYIVNELTHEEFPKYGENRYCGEGNDGIWKIYNHPLAFIQIYLSSKEITYEEAIDHQILSSIGELDIQVDWVGYSELTISYFSTEHLTVGGHDIEKILSSYIGKYAIVNVEIKDEQ
ncbi:hypothetical protein MHB54_00560 [Paenibacillus sp. FSL M7-0802]|uniref:hypothetical protein n=1 Tax=Paenibacillus sp. FSL M7-0802 TaxID=2921536 RepID=UPI0030FCA3ED